MPPTLALSGRKVAAIMSSEVQFAKDEENKLDASHLAQVLLSKGYEEHCSQPSTMTPILHIYDPGTSTESKQASNCTLLSKVSGWLSGNSPNPETLSLLLPFHFSLKWENLALLDCAHVMLNSIVEDNLPCMNEELTLFG
ncbi:hypothetical protein DAI22_05g116500 [Oryza sativa Japonica Group]|nr:hypothetical protein DAI22_05g116500 [Oryza sativa Japonica Group]